MTKSQVSTNPIVRITAFLVVVLVLMLGLETAAFVAFFAYNGLKNPSLSISKLLNTTWTTTGFFYHIKKSSENTIDYKFLPDSVLGYRLRPNHEYSTVDPLSGAEVRPLRTNNFGFISNNDELDVDEVFAADTINIFLTGGSTLQGSGATANSLTTAAQLEKMLNTLPVPEGYKRLRPIRVINAGVAGYNATQEVIYMATELRYLAPSMFIMINGINENIESGEFQGRSYHRTSMLGKSDLDQLPFAFLPALQWGIGRALMKVGLDTGSAQAADVSEPKLAFKRAAERYAGILKSAYGIAHTSDAGFLYMLQPTSGIGQHQFTESELERRNALDIDRETQWEPYIERTDKFYNDVRLQIGMMSGRYEDGVFLDGSGIFDEVTGDVYWDPRHYNDLGQEIIARKLYDVLISMFPHKVFMRARN